MAFSVKAGFRTDRGKMRGNNEDALLVLPRFSIYAVADGVGGHNSGELASRKAVTGIERFIEAHPIDAVYEGDDSNAALMDYFLTCFRDINAEILSLSRSAVYNSGMATTTVVAHICEDRLYIINIGDSRAYMIRDGGISQITVDHTVVNKLISSGKLTREEARVHPRKNEITRALGAEDEVLPDFFVTKLVRGDRLILCTDGLYGEVTDEEICRIAAVPGELNEICKSLVERANKNGGRDNITVICVEIE
ncbi:MAG: Stp1/IreP family PP2C-type Ser/Thr phosphatase [Clostridiales Family XIII bacterium]|jgi:protein phosphatase|nr:Stp1/IreP family PP2C-type Ser/Thr phosphatase [Clostridiales Family XIII bacterium]